MDYFGVFAKYWEPGKVKTRLAASLGNELASEVYRHFVSTLLQRFSHCANRHVLCFTPQEQSERFVQTSGEGWIVKPQATGNLGHRMASFFDASFQEGAERVVLIGSDSPTLPVEYAASAFRLLRGADVVLGPTDDGGYYLVGASRNVPGLFEGIDWSTSRVWEQTVARLNELQLSYQSLPQWYDVDELRDLERLRDELSQQADDDPALSKLLAAINRAI